MFQLDEKRVDAWFDAAVAATGNPPTTRLMDPAALLPFSALPWAVQKETGRQVSRDALETMAAQGWFTVRSPAEEEGEPGVLFVVPSRIALLLDLQDEGWSEEDLRTVGRYEAEMIEWVYTTDDLEYAASAQDQLVRECRNDAEMVTADLRRLDDHPDLFSRTRDFVEGKGFTVTSPDDLESVVEKMKERAKFFENLQWDKISLERRRNLEKTAFKIGLRDEWIRMQMLESDRGKAKAGFTPFLMFQTEGWSREEGHYYENVMWDMTVRSPWFLEQDNPRIRLPGVLIEGRHITPTRSPSPPEYDRVYKEFDLEWYLREWVEVTESRACQHCFAELPEDADSRRRYCKDACRNAAKQARYRARHPDRSFDAQVKYYSQFATDE